MTLNNPVPGSIPDARCQCKAFSDQGWHCQNPIDQEDLLCGVCRNGPCMQMLAGDPLKPLWGHQLYVKDFLEHVRFYWQGPAGG